MVFDTVERFFECELCARRKDKMTNELISTRQNISTKNDQNSGSRVNYSRLLII